jgi:hypothetical protein
MKRNINVFPDLQAVSLSQTASYRELIGFLLSVFFNPEDGSNVFLPNCAKLLPDFMATHF